MEFFSNRSVASAWRQATLHCGAKARRELGWKPKYLDPEAEITALPSPPQPLTQKRKAR
ncbi:hypothetical protein [Bradyrhizobium sp.]|uniref:hypothetical protein n=1 Tax=Bradyrhizobium sp. TaxID=376 RepID=UPI002733F2B9|nr:hypothetical protein [Bradyrhizobium sp.]MDP3077162.1 hypothetical protein [Bradyrhizobium sp.]